ncbi:putative acylesterase/phospholipase RssA [Limimaricola variabilis]|uniref:Acylesterase/phospholipase RssA n=1 Tax=Limimaricola variabilis TaxID=1492771 RepID=A0ABR6HRE4_9RHOB|nr:patatin-like phospholipase family protein [Limimaricola variabilis]MBB3713122.1 putative acylesterase/phospholipase RssA [Limimaricola variabilis]
MPWTAPRQLVFSGGGLRCFWQGGFMEVLGRHTAIAPERITGVSGGALSAATHVAGCERKLLDAMCDAFEEQGSNLFDPDGEGISPHQRIYCKVVSKVLDEAAARRVAEGPQLQILIAHPPAGGLPKISGVAATLAYEAELHLINSPHFSWAAKLGLDCDLVDARQAARDGQLVDLVCAAAVIPPIFEPPDWDGRPVVDGGMADQAPMPEPDTGETLVLLTRRYRKLPEVPGRRYVMPSDETPADKIDFTDPDKLRRTWDQGMRDAEVFCDELGLLDPA